MSVPTLFRNGYGRGQQHRRLEIPAPQESVRMAWEDDFSNGFWAGLDGVGCAVEEAYAAWRAETFWRSEDTSEEGADV